MSSATNTAQARSVLDRTDVQELARSAKCEVIRITDDTAAELLTSYLTLDRIRTMSLMYRDGHMKAKEFAEHVVATLIDNSRLQRQ